MASSTCFEIELTCEISHLLLYKFQVFNECFVKRNLENVCWIIYMNVHISRKFWTKSSTRIVCACVLFYSHVASHLQNVANIMTHHKDFQLLASFPLHAFHTQGVFHILCPFWSTPAHSSRHHAFHHCSLQVTVRFNMTKVLEFLRYNAICEPGSFINIPQNVSIYHLDLWCSYNCSTAFK